ncbi:hypothetical protein JY651_18145 [Pyxidicoccus parkwayensis]|uniref:SCP domain-containing protein n=1 Tax=Pyxidicoccus parkwayensis TaxID=2813578 RepID=A0ABX7P8G6_9BACT|nr:hypothetical protein [Pyxidicoccus parkwaysis]QSQ26728.1 hypothetical protein JY651_18145 [Pyxidicoccus parkwaysis]
MRHPHLKAVLKLAVVVVALACSPAAHAQNVFDPRVFNWLFYLNNNADLLRAGIVTPQAAMNHWQNNGIREGRQATSGFHTLQYLDQYADLRAAFGTNYAAALNHYLTNGINEGRKGYYSGGYGRWTAENDIIRISASARTAGAIDSLMWNGREFINSWDHGRQLQMAVIANNWGECYNPTQAGSSNDGLSSGTTSILEGTYSEPSRLAFQTRPAFWLAAGQAHPFPSPNCTRAINTTNVSNYVMNTDIRVGFMGIRHAIEFNMAVQVPESINAFQLEGPTGYLSGEFSSFHAMDFATGTLVPLSQANEELTRPVVLSVPDGSAAMGVWSPELPGPNASQYAKFAFIDSGNPANSTTKWSAVFRRGALAPGGYGFRSFIFVGTRENVRVAMLQVRNLFLTGQAH